MFCTLVVAIPRGDGAALSQSMTMMKSQSPYGEAVISAMTCDHLVPVQNARLDSGIVGPMRQVTKSPTQKTIAHDNKSEVGGRGGRP